VQLALKTQFEEVYFLTCDISFLKKIFHLNNIHNFIEHYYTIPLLQFATRFNDSVQYHNITLTAHILITMQEVMQVVQGSIRNEVAKASIKAVRLVPYFCFSCVVCL
jgi:hypothetical protein